MRSGRPLEPKQAQEKRDEGKRMRRDMTTRGLDDDDENDINNDNDDDDDASYDKCDDIAEATASSSICHKRFCLWRCSMTSISQMKRET